MSETESNIHPVDSATLGMTAINVKRKNYLTTNCLGKTLLKQAGIYTFTIFLQQLRVSKQMINFFLKHGHPILRHFPL